MSARLPNPVSTNSEEDGFPDPTDFNPSDYGYTGDANDGSYVTAAMDYWTITGSRNPLDNLIQGSWAANDSDNEQAASAGDQSLASQGHGNDASWYSCLGVTSIDGVATALCVTGDGYRVLEVGLGIPGGEALIGHTVDGSPALGLLTGNSVSGQVGVGVGILGGIIGGVSVSLPTGSPQAYYTGVGTTSASYTNGTIVGHR